MDVALVKTLDELSARASPASQVEDIGGWVARCSPDLATQRANSVWPRSHHPCHELSAKLASVEHFYSRHGLPVRYQISPAAQPRELEQMLQRRGYAAGPPTAVMRCELAGLAGGPSAPRMRVRIDPTLTPGWWAALQAARDAKTARLSAMAALVGRVSAQQAFAIVTVDGIDSAVALGVLDGEWLGIFNMATRLAQRRRGAGRTAVATLAAWARQRGAEAAYLQVDRDNDPALELYRAVGFEHVYSYAYLAHVAEPSQRPPS